MGTRDMPATDLWVASRFDGALAGVMGMADAGIIWWLDLHGGSEDTLVDRLTREITVSSLTCSHSWASTSPTTWCSSRRPDAAGAFLPRTSRHAIARRTIVTPSRIAVSISWNSQNRSFGW